MCNFSLRPATLFALSSSYSSVYEVESPRKGFVWESRVCHRIHRRAYSMCSPSDTARATEKSARPALMGPRRLGVHLRTLLSQMQHGKGQCRQQNADGLAAEMNCLLGAWMKKFRRRESLGVRIRVCLIDKATFRFLPRQTFPLRTHQISGMENLSKVGAKGVGRY